MRWEDSDSLAFQWSLRDRTTCYALSSWSSQSILDTTSDWSGASQLESILDLTPYQTSVSGNTWCSKCAVASLLHILSSLASPTKSMSKPTTILSHMSSMTSCCSSCFAGCIFQWGSLSIWLSFLIQERRECARCMAVNPILCSQWKA